jgi:hypothetical protein
MNDPTSLYLRTEPTRLERLERPMPAPRQPITVETKPAVSRATEDPLNARIEAIRRPGPGR